MSAVPVYRCEFERIGRERSVPPQDFAATTADELAHVVHGFARKYIASRDYEVLVYLDEGIGKILAGGRPAGNFTISDRAPAVASDFTASDFSGRDTPDG